MNANGSSTLNSKKSLENDMNYYCEKCDASTGDDGKDQNVINAPSMKEGLCSDCQDMDDIKEAKAKLDTYLEIHDELVDRCTEWIEEFGYVGHYLQHVSIDVNNEAYPPYILATYDYERETGYGPQDETGEEKVPLSIMWDFECVAKEKKKRMDKQLVAMRKNEEKKKVQDLRDKANRYEQFLKLSEEFDDEKD